MSMFFDAHRSGSWSYTSTSDPRWNCSGRTNTNAFFGPCPEAEQALKDKRKTLGKPPRDLEFSYMKD